MITEEFIEKNKKSWETEQGSEVIDNVEELLIEFAKMQVRLALDTIYEESKHGDEEHQKWLKEKFDSYDLNNIK